MHQICNIPGIEQIASESKEEKDQHLFDQIACLPKSFLTYLKVLIISIINNVNNNLKVFTI